MNKTIFFFVTCYISSIFSHTPYLEKDIYSLSKTHKIPKIIHQIWVGKKDIPKKYIQFMETWKQMHPDWTYILWTDENIDSFPWQNKAAFLATKNVGMKSDIWRYEILHAYGGLYADTDIECIRPFDPIHERLEFYSGFDSVKKETIGNHLIASAPKSTIIKNILCEMSKQIHKIRSRNKSPMHVIRTTGPFFLARCVKKDSSFKSNKRAIIFDEEYFQPVLNSRGGVPHTEKEKWDVENTCFCIHYNGCSWFLDVK